MSKLKSRYQGKPRGPRWPLLTGIVIFHLVALYGLTRFLAPEFTASVEREVTSAFTVVITTPDEEPEPPEAPPEPDEGAAGDPGREAVPEPVTAPRAPLTPRPTPRPQASSTGTARSSGARDEGEGTGAAGPGDGTGSGASGSGQGNGNAIAERPSVRSGNLDIRRDFPVPEGGREARFGASVTVVFTVTTDGRARNCSVRNTSADAASTALVCGLVMEKIRFNPARTVSGEAVEARYGYRVDFRER